MIELRTILDKPVVYQQFQRLGGFFGARILTISRFLVLSGDEKILDIGCGPGFLRPYLPRSSEYIGFDTDKAYIDFARNNHGENAVYHHGVFDAESIPPVAPVDVVLMFGLLHHLDDDQAKELLNLAANTLTPEGCIITLDGCYDEMQSNLRSKMLDWDRGKLVRNEAQYTAPPPSTVDVFTYYNEKLYWILYCLYNCVAKRFNLII